MKRCIAWLATSFLAASISNADVALSSAGDGHDTIPVLVDGHGPYPFILDTGADSSAVYRWFADSAHLAKNGQQNLSGQTGSAIVPMYRIKDLELEGRHLRHLAVFGFANRHDAGREAGVLGNDFMDGALVTFDFPCRRVEVQEHWNEGSLSHPIMTGVDKGTTLLTLPVEINGFTGIAMIDTGSRISRLTPSFARAAHIDLASFRDGEAIYGANNKKMVPRNGIIGTVRFGGVTLSKVEAQVFDVPVLEEDFHGKPAMILGADLLGRFRLVYDHHDRKIWLQPSRCTRPH